MTDNWSARIGRHITTDGSVLVPPRIAAFLEHRAGLTGERRILLRDTDPAAYEVLAALHLAALAHRSGDGTKDAEPQPNQPHWTQWLTTSQAAQQVGVTDRCIRKWIRHNKLPATRHGDRWLINPHHLNIPKLTA